jgi:hypothetical protein
LKIHNRLLFDIFLHKGEFMGELAAKTKPARYPMGTTKQARNTLSRLTRDLLNGKIDREKYRAACYGLSVLCSLFKFETPEQKDIDIIIKKPDFLLESPEERKARLDEILKETLPFYNRYLENVKQWEQEDHEKIVREQNERIERVISEGKANLENIEFIESIGVTINETVPEIEVSAKVTNTGTSWQPCGIGAKNR